MLFNLKIIRVDHTEKKRPLSNPSNSSTLDNNSNNNELLVINKNKNTLMVIVLLEKTETLKRVVFYSTFVTHSEHLYLPPQIQHN